MFETWFPRHWTTLKKLIWLRKTALGNVIKTVTGAIVTFVTSKARPIIELVATLTPSQDLHGYNNPWPAGGGVNKFDKSTAVNGKWLNVSTGAEENSSTSYVLSDYIPVKANTTYTMLNPKSSRRWLYDTNKDPVEAIPNTTFTPSVDGYCRITLSLIENPSFADTFMLVEGSVLPQTYSPYSNICPISGHTGVTVYRTGKNLFDKNSAQITEGWWYAGECTAGEPLPIYAASGNYHTSSPIPVVAGQTLTVVGCGGGNGSFLYLDKDMNYLDGFANQSQSSRTFTVPNNPQIAYLRFPFATSTIDTCQLELGSTASEYEPYTGNTYPITFPDAAGTVYGGTLTVNEDGTGQIVVKSAYKRLGDTSTEISYSSPVFVVTCTGIKNPPNNNTVGNIISSAFVPVKQSALTTTPNSVAIPATIYNIARIYAPDYSDVNSFRTAFADESIVYELATPITIPLTETQVINTLKGTNVVWVDDSDEISVTYYE